MEATIRSENDRPSFGPSPNDTTAEIERWTIAGIRNESRTSGATTAAANHQNPL
jgi:hypothetical protein